MRNPEFDAGSLADYPDNAALEAEIEVRIRLPEAARVRDIRSGADFGLTDQVSAKLGPWSPVLLELR